jgi:hypothetical protein
MALAIGLLSALLLATLAYGFLRAEKTVEVEPERAATIARTGEAGRAQVLVVNDEAAVGSAVRRLLEGRHSVVVVPSRACE